MKVCLEATIEQQPPERASERPPRRRRRAAHDLRHDLLAPALEAGQQQPSRDAAPLSYSVCALAVLSPRQSELAAEPPARQHQALTPGEGHAGVENPWLLNELFDQAAHDPAGPLPQQPLLESLAGQPLEQVQVYSGPRARVALAILGAEAATRGRQILLAAAEPPLETLLHEVIHVLQSELGGPAQIELTSAGAPPEREAETLVESLLAAGGARQEQRRPVGPALRAGRDPLQPPVQAGLGPYAIALRRTTDAQPLPSGVEPSLRKPEETFATAVAERIPEPPRPAEQRSSAEEPARVAEERERQREEAREGAPSGDVGVEAGAFELPPPPEPGIAEEDVAAREQALAQAEAALEQAADPEGLMGAFADAPPTLKARRQDRLGEDMTGVAQQEDAQFQAELPDFHAQLSGEVEPAPELEVGAPEGGEVALEEAPPAPAPEPEVAPTVDPGPYSENEALVRDLLRMFFGDSADRAEDVGDALRRVETSDSEIDDSPGPPPPVPLEGETDPERVNSQASEGLDQSREKRDEAQRAVLEGPGPERAQPRVMDEVVTLPELPQPALEQLAPVEGAETYLALELPPEVQTAFDQQQQAAMQASMEGARAEVARATDERDTARAGELDKANQQAEELNQQADAQQRDQVMQARHQIQDSRQATMQAQGDAVQELESEVAAERASQLEAIDDRVAEDEATIAERYEQAESDAEDKIEEGEGKAEAERKEAEKEAEEESWWDAAVDFIEDAFEALTDAINAIFDAVRDAVNAILDAVKDFAIGLIDAAASFIKGAIGLFGDFLKGAVDLLLSDTFPGLAAELNEAIDGAVVTLQEGVDMVADGLKAGISALVEGLRAGLNAILDVFQGAVNAALALAEAALTGDWAELGRKALEAILKVAGISPEDFYAFVGRAADTFQLIVADPGAFLGHCVDAVVAGVEKFAGNFLDHLKRGIIAWLTGALGDLTMPERFDLAGILDLARQILGLTWDRLRARAVKYLGAEAVEMVEFVVDHLQMLIEGGWAALFERVKEELSGVYDTVLDGIKSFLVREVIEAAITKLATMFNPVGAIVQLVLTAWNLFNFLRNQLERIMQVVRTVVDAIGEIARGVIEPAAGKVEEVLGNLLPVAIDLLASLFGVTGVSRQVRNVIEGIRERVDAAIDRLIDKVKGMFKRGAKGDKAGPADQAAQKADAGAKAAGPKPGRRLVGERLPFEVEGGETHHLSVVLEGKDATVLVESTARTLFELKKHWLEHLDWAATPDDRTKAEDLLEKLLPFDDQIEELVETAVASDPATATPGAGAVKTAAPLTSNQHTKLTKSKYDLVQLLKDLYGLLYGIDDLKKRPDIANLTYTSKFLVLHADELKKADLVAQRDILDAVNRIAEKRGVFKKWKDMKEKLMEKDFYTSPLLRTFYFGQAVQNEVTQEILPGVIKDKGLQMPPNVNIFMTSALLPQVHGEKTDEHKKALELVKERIFDHTKQGTSRQALAEAAHITLKNYVAQDVDEDLKKAVRNAGIIAFLLALAKGGSVDGIDEAEFKKRWTNNQANKDWLKDEFRKPGTKHEWIPSNVMDKVLERAKAARVTEELSLTARWIEFYDEFRIPTKSLIFHPSSGYVQKVKGRPGIEDPKKLYSVLQGHVGAVYAPVEHNQTIAEIKQQTVGTNLWHDQLRTIFVEGAKLGDSKSAMKQIIENVEKYFIATIWKGDTLSGNIFEEYYESAKAASLISLSALQSRQDAAYKAALLDFKSFLTKFGS